jgi:hypothetical protein
VITPSAPESTDTDIKPLMDQARASLMDPERLAELTATLKPLLAEAQRSFQRRGFRLCARPNCRRPLTEGIMTGGRLMHLGPDGETSMRGCRAASFDWTVAGWDERIDRNQYPK